MDHHYNTLRVGFCDYDDLSQGFVARNTWTGRIDAPDYMPQGSTLAAFGRRPSYATRDVLTGHADIGVHHCA